MPQGIAIERHAKRDAGAIQQAWNARRIANIETRGIANIEKRIKIGLLPKEVISGLSALPQNEFGDRIASLIGI